MKFWEKHSISNLDYIWMQKRNSEKGTLIWCKLSCTAKPFLWGWIYGVFSQGKSRCVPVHCTDMINTLAKRVLLLMGVIQYVSLRLCMIGVDNNFPPGCMVMSSYICEDAVLAYMPYSSDYCQLLAPHCRLWPKKLLIALLLKFGLFWDLRFKNLTCFSNFCVLSSLYWICV